MKEKIYNKLNLTEYENDILSESMDIARIITKKIIVISEDLQYKYEGDANFKRKRRTIKKDLLENIICFLVEGNNND